MSIHTWVQYLVVIGHAVSQMKMIFYINAFMTGTFDRMGSEVERAGN